MVPDFREPKLDSCVHKIALLDQILGRLNPVHIFTLSLPKIHCTITQPSMSMLPTWTSPSMLSIQHFTDSLHFPVSKYIPTCFAHHMHRELIIMTILCDEFKLWSFAFCCFVFRRFKYKYSPQNFVLDSMNPSYSLKVRVGGKYLHLYKKCKVVVFRFWWVSGILSRSQ